MALSKGTGASQQGAAHAPLVLCVGGRRQRGTLHRQQAAQRVNASRAESGKGDVDAVRVGGGGQGRVAPEGNGEAPGARHQRIAAHVSHWGE